MDWHVKYDALQRLAGELPMFETGPRFYLVNPFEVAEFGLSWCPRVGKDLRESVELLWQQLTSLKETQHVKVSTTGGGEYRRVRWDGHDWRDLTSEELDEYRLFASF